MATIRPFCPQDEAEVTRLWQEIFPDDPPHNAPHLVIRQKRLWQPELFFVLEVETKLVGTVMAGYDGHRGWLNSIAVKPGHRRRGYGLQLVRHAETALKRIGCPKVNLQIRETNTEVAAFYSKLGYHVEARINMGKLLTPVE
jgi:hypothetical protein